MTEDEKRIKKREALIDYNLAKKDEKNDFKKKSKKLLIIMVVLLFIGVLIRIIHGRIYYSVSFLNLNKSVEYKAYVNGEHVSVAFEDKEDIPIIPGLFYFRRENKGSWYNMEKLNDDLIFDEEKVILDFVVSECYTKNDNVRVSCDKDNGNFKHKEVDVNFTRLFIRKNSGKRKTFYDGKFIKDISSYVKEKGYYYIEIHAEYDDINTILYLFPIRKEKLNENDNL